MRYCFLFDSWLSLKKSVESAVSIIIYLIGVVKINTKIFFKATIYGLMEDWPGGFYIVFRINPMVTGERPLISTSYKYNSWKVLSFFAIGGHYIRYSIFIGLY